MHGGLALCMARRAMPSNRGDVFASMSSSMRSEGHAARLGSVRFGCLWEIEIEIEVEALKATQQRSLAQDQNPSRAHFSKPLRRAPRTRTRVPLSLTETRASLVSSSCARVCLSAPTSSLPPSVRERGCVCETPRRKSSFAIPLGSTHTTTTTTTQTHAHLCELHQLVSARTDIHTCP